MPRERLQSDSRPNYQPLPVMGLAFGELPGEAFGRGVALYRSGNQPYVAVGVPFANEGGTNLSGGARIFRLSADGSEAVEVAGFGGENEREGGLLGALIHVGQLAGRPHLVVGGYYGSSEGMDSGSAYVFDVAF